MDDALAAARVDELLNTVEQVTGLLSPTTRERDSSICAAMRRTFSDESLPFWMAALERRLVGHEDGPWCGGDRMTIADLVVWRLLVWLTSGMLHGVSTDLPVPHPRLKTLCHAVSTVPGVSRCSVGRGRFMGTAPSAPVCVWTGGISLPMLYGVHRCGVGAAGAVG